MTTPALYFHADAIESEGKDLVGRRSAGQSFLRGFLAHVPGPVLRAVTQDRAAAGNFESVVRAMGQTRDIQVSTLRGGSDFTKMGTIFFPGPGYQDAAWRRQRLGMNRCSLVGVTHTVSTRRVIEAMHHLMLEPVADWDAIICTSRAVQSVVGTQMEMEAEYIKSRFGARRVPQPQLPLIPLGIVTADFSQTQAARARMRARFAAPAEAIVVMCMGRLTSVEKANPAPLFIALEEVAQTTGKAIHLWLVGWASRADETALHEAGARALAPSVSMTIIDGRLPDIRRHIWAGADIFTLSVDNIQETFGLVPVEAMAAGLPVVMPDWDGFRDTVRHGETGFLIPTRMQPGGTEMGQRIARRFADGTDDYLRYLSLIQQQTQIDLRAYVAALTSLVQDAGLRKQMGKAGQRHVQQNLDWAAIIPRYLSLADELAQRRAGAQTLPLAASPIEIDPFELYRAYPSHRLDDTDRIILRKGLDQAGLDALDSVNGRALYGRKIISDDQMLSICGCLMQATGGITLKDLIRAGNIHADATRAAVLFLAKYDYVTIVNQQTE